MNKPIPRFLLIAVGLFSLTSCKRTAESPSPSPPVTTETSLPSPELSQLSQGLICLYNAQYEQARLMFGQVIDHHPLDPAGYFYLTAVDWWQLAQDFELAQPAVAKRLEADSKKTRDVSETFYKQSESQKAKARALLYEGGAWGLQGRFEITRGHWLAAYRAGKRGHALLKEALSLDPHLYDAYLGLGIYDYYSDTLKGAQAILSKLLVHGSRKHGLEETQLALEKGKYARVEAMLFLIDMDTSFEKKPEEAVQLAQALHKDNPQSPVMHLALIGTLAADHQWDAVSAEAQAFLQHAEQETPFYTRRLVPAGLYYEGLSALHKGNSKTCIDRMEAVMAFPELPAASRWLTFAYLRRGQAYDLLEDRARATADYKRVLSCPDVWGSHEEASSGLKIPFR